MSCRISAFVCDFRIGLVGKKRRTVILLIRGVVPFARSCSSGDASVSGHIAQIDALYDKLKRTQRCRLEFARDLVDHDSGYHPVNRDVHGFLSRKSGIRDAYHHQRRGRIGRKVHQIGLQCRFARNRRQIGSIHHGVDASFAGRTGEGHRRCGSLLICVQEIAPEHEDLQSLDKFFISSNGFLTSRRLHRDLTAGIHHQGAKLSFGIFDFGNRLVTRR